VRERHAPSVFRPLVYHSCQARAFLAGKQGVEVAVIVWIHRDSLLLWVCIGRAVPHRVWGH
jgi:hypothetical protein